MDSVNKIGTDCDVQVYSLHNTQVQHAWEKARGSVLTVPLERKSILKLVAAARAGSSRVRASAMLPVYSG